MASGLTRGGTLHRRPHTRRRRRLARRRCLGWALLVVVLPLLLGASEALLWGRLEGSNILIVGLDAPKPRQLEVGSDVVAVVHLGRPITVTSVTRDLRVLLVGPKTGLRKLSASYTEGGPQLTRLLVSDCIGAPIDHCVVLDFRGFEQVVDAVGGVELDVPAGMRHRDVAGGTSIDLSPGMQLLDGNSALDFVRWRQGDLDRIGRQQQFGRAFLRRLLLPGNIARLGQIAEAIGAAVKTDLSAADIAALLLTCSSLDPAQALFAQPEGRHAVSSDWLYVLAKPKDDPAFSALREATSGDDEPLAGDGDVGTAGGLLKRAEQLRKTGCPEGAIDLLGRLAATYPSAAEARAGCLTLASMLVATGRVSEAIGTLTAVAQTQGETPGASALYEVLGHLHLAQYECSDAYLAWRRAVELQPDESGKAGVVGRVLDSFEAMRKPELAALNLGAWPAAALPDDLKLLLAGHAAVHKNDSAAASTAYTGLIEQHPDSLFAAEAAVNCGKLAAAAGKLDVAEELYAGVAERYPYDHEQNARALYCLACLRETQERTCDAIGLYAAVTHRYPDATALCILAKKALANAKSAEALVEPLRPPAAVEAYGSLVGDEALPVEDRRWSAMQALQLGLQLHCAEPLADIALRLAATGEGLAGVPPQDVISVADRLGRRGLHEAAEALLCAVDGPGLPAELRARAALHRAHGLARQGRIEESIDGLRLVAASPGASPDTVAAACLEEAYIEIGRGRPAEAVAPARRAAAQQVQSKEIRAKSLYYLAQAYRESGRAEDAVEWFEGLTVELPPSAAQAHNRAVSTLVEQAHWCAARICIELGRPQAALPHIEALQAGPWSDAECARSRAERLRRRIGAEEETR